MTTVFKTNFLKPRANDYTTKQPILLKGMFFLKLCSVQFSHSVLSKSLWSLWLQHANLPCPSPITNSQSLLKLISITSVMPSKHFTLCCPLLLPPSLSQHQGLFQWVSSSHQVSKYWSFSFSISPSNEYSRLISFRIDWFDLLAIQETLKSLLQHHSSKASICQHLAFFIVQLSHLYMTTGKPYLWLYRPLLAEWHLCFLTCCLGLS